MSPDQIVTQAIPEPSIGELIAARPHLAMHAMDGLVIDDVPLNSIGDAVGTPTWVYSAASMRGRYRSLAAALSEVGLDAHIHYAMKANDRLAVLRLFAAEGAGVDVVSEGELLRAREAGIPADRIVFSGVGKTTRELRLALTEDIAQINVESAEELNMLSAVADGMGRTARIALRVNPDVDAGTHAKITTGLAHNKFGIAYGNAAELYQRAAALPGLQPIGLAVHIGSQILLRHHTAPLTGVWLNSCAFCVRRANRSMSLTAAAASAFRIATSRHRPRLLWPGRSAVRCTTLMCVWCWSLAVGWLGRRACCWPRSSW